MGYLIKSIEPVYLPNSNPLGPINYMGSFTCYSNVLLSMRENEMKLKEGDMASMLTNNRREAELL
jgi:hypothetical protein